MPRIVKKPAATEIGEEAGIAINGIIVNRDYNSELVGSKGVRIYDEMRLGDATVKASLMAIFLPILSARWYVEAGEDSRQGKKIAEWVEDELKNKGTRTWQETLSTILLYLVYGRMPFELVFEFREDGSIGLRKLSPRWPDTIYSWVMENGQAGITQQTVSGTYNIPMDKLVIFVNQKEGDNWEGMSILRSAYKHWYIKDKLYLIDAISAERQGLGIPYAKYPTGTSDKIKDEVEELLQNMRANEKAYMMWEGLNVEVGFMDMKAGQVKNLMPVIQHHDRQITKNVLAQFLELGATGMGSYALSADQSRLFLLSIESVANYVSDVVNKYVIKKLVDYNFDVEDYPQLRVEKIGTVNGNELSTTLQRLLQTGIIKPTVEDETWVRDVLDLPESDGRVDVDITMADGIIADLENEMAELTGKPVEEGEDELEEEVTDEEIQEAADQMRAIYKAKDWKEIQALDKLYGKETVRNVIEAGARGVPLSEETKRKISEALSKGKGGKGKKGKGKGKGKGKNPELVKKQAEIKKLALESKKFSDEARRKLLELKAQGKKMTPEETAKQQLEFFNQKTKISDKITQLRTEIDEIRAKSAPPQKKASIERKMEKVGALIDELEKE